MMECEMIDNIEEAECASDCSSCVSSGSDKCSDLLELINPMPLDVYVKGFFYKDEEEPDSDLICRLRMYNVIQVHKDRSDLFGVSNSKGDKFFAYYLLKAFYKTEKKCHEILDPQNCPSIIKMFGAIPLNKGGIILTHIHMRYWYKVVSHEVKDVMKQLLQAIKVCHDNRIAHRNIKPWNIVWDFSDEAMIEIYLTDFSRACYNFTEYKYRTIEPDRIPGTLRYLSPEHLRGEIPPDPRVGDIFAAGLVFLELITDKRTYRKLFFPTGTLDEIHDFINRFDSNIGHELLPSAADLLKRMLAIDFTKRITAAEALEHQFFKDMKEYFYRSSYAITHGLSLKNIDDPSWIIEHKLEDK